MEELKCGIRTTHNNVSQNLNLKRLGSAGGICRMSLGDIGVLLKVQMSNI